MRGLGGGGGGFKEKGKYTKHLAEIFPDCRFVMFGLPSHFSPLRVLGEGGGGGGHLTKREDTPKHLS